MIGFYDGFLDQGQDRFNFAFLLIGLDFIQAASGKLLNFVSNIVSLITFYF